MSVTDYVKLEDLPIFSLEKDIEKSLDTRTLEERMKDYENVYKIHLDYGTPKIIRLDMRSGKNFTKGLDKPFDKFFSHCMVETTKQLCAHIPGARLGYTQSDEITIVVKDINKTNQKVGFFNNSLTKITSVVASLCTSIFNKIWTEEVAKLSKEGKSTKGYIDKIFLGVFDCRFFEVPNETEIMNNLLWRQNDCYRNAVNAAAIEYFSQKELEGKNTQEKINMLEQVGHSFQTMPMKFSKGIVCYKIPESRNNVERFKWEDTVAPSFKSNLQFITGVYNGTGLFV